MVLIGPLGDVVNVLGYAPSAGTSDVHDVRNPAVNSPPGVIRRVGSVSSSRPVITMFRNASASWPIAC